MTTTFSVASRPAGTSPVMCSQAQSSTLPQLSPGRIGRNADGVEFVERDRLGAAQHLRVQVAHPCGR